MQIGPPGDSHDAFTLDKQIVLVQISMHHCGCEVPEVLVLHGVLPAAQQQRRHLSGGRCGVQLVEPPLPQPFGGVSRQIGMIYHRFGEVMDGGRGPPQVLGQLGPGTGELGKLCGGAGQVVVDEDAHVFDPGGTGHRGYAEGKLRADRCGEAAQHLDLSLQAHRGLRVLGAPNPPSVA